MKQLQFLISDMPISNYITITITVFLFVKRVIRIKLQLQLQFFSRSILTRMVRDYRNRHLGTLMRCCEAWEPVEKCLDPSSFECIDFHGLSQIIASLTRESLAEREAEKSNVPGTQTEKDNALVKCRLAWTSRLARQETNPLPPRCYR